MSLMVGHGEVSFCVAGCYFANPAVSDVPDGRSILSTKHDAIARFIHVIQALRTVYNLPPTSLHIFFDVEGGTIGFNRNASIFLNLRYYESWRASSSILSCFPGVCEC